MGASANGGAARRWERIEDEIDAWLETNEGRFARYLARRQRAG